METIKKYFPHLTPQQLSQFEQLDALYRDWNAKINVISRKDIDGLYLHHVLHSLSIGLVFHFTPGTRILDFGTGGGFPGIPLAILFPECKFRLIDGTGKKILVAKEVAKAIGLSNVEVIQRRGEEERDKFHFVVSRAVMPMPDLMKIVKKNISNQQQNAFPNGVVALKGGDLTEEMKPYAHVAEVTPLGQLMDEEWFETKNIVYVPV